jgi:hypothetical protein
MKKNVGWVKLGTLCSTVLLPGKDGLNSAKLNRNFFDIKVKRTEALKIPKQTVWSKGNKTG